MRLGNLIKEIDFIELVNIGDYDEEIEGISYNSKKTKRINLKSLSPLFSQVLASSNSCTKCNIVIDC